MVVMFISRFLISLHNECKGMVNLYLATYQPGWSYDYRSHTEYRSDPIDCRDWI